MSIWTHVAGVIRVDDIRLSDEIPDFNKLIGKECHWDSPNDVWDDQEKHPEEYLPMGSEGSLEKSIWVNPSKSCMSAYTISVFGDLRDYETPEIIKEWFKEKCKSLWVRDAVITIDCENGESVVYKYEEEA